MTTNSANFLQVDNIEKAFNETKAVDRVSFGLRHGEFFTLLGPSGCGKTTTLRAIAGFETIDAGRIIIDGTTVSDPAAGIHFAPERRNFGMVFQSYAVWPHMTVAQNVAYGLHNLKLRRSEQKERVRRVLKMVGLEEQIDRPATKLSGGQQQRVALARAIVYEPKVLLFDEPLSNLDAKLRERMRLELRRLQAELGITSVYVTHDQEEAMVVSDRVIVMNMGRIQQFGTPDMIYDRPANRFVADFIGSSNLLNGKVESATPSSAVVQLADAPISLTCIASQQFDKAQKVSVCFRPENAKLQIEPPEQQDNVIEVSVARCINMGSYLDYRVFVADQEVRVNVPRGSEVPAEGSAYMVIDRKNCLCLADE